MAGHTAYQLYAHVTWHTWKQVGCIDRAAAQDVRASVGIVSQRLRIRVLGCAILADHVHLLVSYSPDSRLSDIVRLVKCGSATQANARVPGALRWGRGCFAASVSKRDLPRLRTYIARQFDRHPERVPRVSRSPF